jgi:Low molecular weight phosphotyrosine protein phosphatase
VFLFFCDQFSKPSSLFHQYICIISQSEEKAVLFVCIENAERSQMAEAFFRKYASGGYLSISAGTRPAGEINPIAI